MKKNTLYISILIIIALAGIAGTAYFGYEYKQKVIQNENLQAQLQTFSQDPAVQLRIENQKIIDAVGSLITLPSDETPTIATVTDLSQLQGLPLFQNAALGDKVLIYTKSKKAILYRPSENKIIDIAPLTE